jgi:hypothetical protein
MITIKFQINIEKPRWFNKLFKCKHEVVSVTENPYSRYGCKTSYSYCLKCGRVAMEIENNCEHEENCFGVCNFCGKRLSKFNCKHDWVNEPDTNDFYCDKCGEWKE